MSKLNIKPLADRVLIEPAAAETKTSSGIIIPDSAKEKPQKGTVVAVGKGTKENPITVKVGDQVLYGKYNTFVYFRLCSKNMQNIINADVKPVINAEQLNIFQQLVINMPVSDHVIDFAVNFVRSTRLDEHTDESIKKWLNWGAGPRASSILILAGKAHALMNNRTTPEIEDIKHVVKPVLRHRIIPNFNAEADGMSCDNILDYLLNKAE